MVFAWISRLCGGSNGRVPDQDEAEVTVLSPAKTFRPVRREALVPLGAGRDVGKPSAVKYATDGPSLGAMTAISRLAPVTMESVDREVTVNVMSLPTLVFSEVDLGLALSVFEGESRRLELMEARLVGKPADEFKEIYSRMGVVRAAGEILVRILAEAGTEFGPRLPYPANPDLDARTPFFVSHEVTSRKLEVYLAMLGFVEKSTIGVRAVEEVGFKEEEAWRDFCGEAIFAPVRSCVYAILAQRSAAMGSGHLMFPSGIPMSAVYAECNPFTTWCWKLCLSIKGSFVSRAEYLVIEEKIRSLDPRARRYVLSLNPEVAYLTALVEYQISSLRQRTPTTLAATRKYCKDIAARLYTNPIHVNQWVDAIFQSFPADQQDF